MIRAVLDTNIIVGRFLSRKAGSPNVEIVDRLEQGEFTTLISEDIVIEYLDLLDRKNVPVSDRDDFIRSFLVLSEFVEILFFHLEHYPSDPDDVCFLLCALNGKASHLVSNDKHLLELEGVYDLKICKTIPFLEDLRG